jgi:hypothetical protein
LFDFSQNLYLLRYNDKREAVMGKVQASKNSFFRSRINSKKKNANGNGGKPASSRKVLFEPLEPRLLMSSDLSYTGTAAFDLTLRYDTPSQRLQLIDNQSATAVAEQDLSQTDHVIVIGSNQSDSLTIDFSSLSDKIDFSALSSDFIQFEDYSLVGSDNDTLKVSGRDIAWSFSDNDSGVAFADHIKFDGIENLGGGLKWSLPPRYADLDLDGRPDMPNTREYANPDHFAINFDMTSFLAGNANLSELSIAIEGLDQENIINTSTGMFQAVVSEQGNYNATLTVKSSEWINAITIKDVITVKDYLFVAIGDSYSSGEGNPETAISRVGRVERSETRH